MGDSAWSRILGVARLSRWRTGHELSPPPDRRPFLTPEQFQQELDAPVDAVLLLAGASDEVLRLAKGSWHNWALGVQLYDDAVDVEEDLGSSAPSWTVLRVLTDMSHGPGGTPTASPESDAFYEAALKRGAVFETLRRAEWFFRQSAVTAGGRFPTWVALQEACLNQTRKLREDLRALVPSMGGA